MASALVDLNLLGLNWLCPADCNRDGHMHAGAAVRGQKLRFMVNPGAKALLEYLKANGFRIHVYHQDWSRSLIDLIDHIVKVTGVQPDMRLSEQNIGANLYKQFQTDYVENANGGDRHKNIVLSRKQMATTSDAVMIQFYTRGDPNCEYYDINEDQLGDMVSVITGRG